MLFQILLSCQPTEPPYGWLLTLRRTSPAADNPQEKWKCGYANRVPCSSVFIFLHIIFPTKGILPNDAITLIASICILDFHCVSYPIPLI